MSSSSQARSSDSWVRTARARPPPSTCWWDCSNPTRDASCSAARISPHCRSVEQNLLAVLETLPLTEEERYARLQTLLDELGISKLAKSKAGVLSGGERRRVEITRALVLDPTYLCLDEPFAGIDPITVVEIQRVVSYLKERGIGVLMSDHNVHATLSIIDRAYIIHSGKILFEGKPRDIVASDAVRQVFLGERFKLAR
jgi:lipopolysaccharide export system ATP-binding protein